MKKKYIYILLFAILLMGSYAYYRYEIYPYQWNDAEKNFELYIKEQHVDKNNIESIEKLKEKKIGGIVYRVKYKDDENLIYEYLYTRDDTVNPYNISLTICNKKLNSIGDKLPHKYPVLEKENNKYPDWEKENNK